MINLLNISRYPRPPPPQLGFELSARVTNIQVLKTPLQGGNFSS